MQRSVRFLQKTLTVFNFVKTFAMCSSCCKITSKKFRHYFVCLIIIPEGPTSAIYIYSMDVVLFTHSIQRVFLCIFYLLFS